MSKHSLIFYVNVIGTAAACAFAIGLVLLFLYRLNNALEEYSESKESSEQITTNTVIEVGGDEDE